MTLMISNAKRMKPCALAGITCLLAVSAASTSAYASSNSPEGATTDATINVLMPDPPPPNLAAFTAKTGIKVNWENVDFESMETKIVAASTANTYFADATDVDWSVAGEYAKLKWFYPIEQYLNVQSMMPDVAQLAAFKVGSVYEAVPYDSSFGVTTINTVMFKKAGITSIPTTIAEYTEDLQALKAKGVVKYPLNIPFAAGEWLSTYWYELSYAYGGHVLSTSGKPLFTNPSSPGYKAAAWMVNAMKTGLVAPGEIDETGPLAFHDLVAKGLVATTFQDNAGHVGTLYDNPSASTVVGQIEYIRVPGLNGPVAGLEYPDGIGIPRTAKNPKAAAALIAWLTSEPSQATFAGLNGAANAWSAGMPNRSSVLEQLAAKGLAGGRFLLAALKASQPAFSPAPPVAYPQFSEAVYTNLHEAAAGTESVAGAMNAIASVANQIASEGD